MTFCLYALVLCVSVWLLFKWQNTYWLRRGVRGPAGVPLFGNMYRYFMKRKHFGELYDEMYQKYPKAEYIGFYKFGTPSVLVRSVDLMRTVLVDNFSSFADNDVHLDGEMDPLLAKNPFFCMGDSWRQIRSQFGPIFTASKVRLAQPLVANVCEKLVRFIDERQGVEMEALILFRKFTLASVASCGFGIEAKTFIDGDSDFVVKAQNVFEMSSLQMFRLMVVQFLPIFGRIFKLSLISSNIDAWVRALVADVTSQREGAVEHRSDFLQALLDAKAKSTNPSEYDEHTVPGHSFSFLTEGSETSSTTMSYCLYELARNADVRQRVCSEVDAAFGGSGGHITDEGLQQLPYLETVIYETLRVHSVVFTINRVCTKDFKLPPQFADGSAGGVTITKGTPVILPIYSLHKDPEVFENPLEFRPERFSEAGSTKRPRNTFLGFGEGPRICPGIRFGMLQVKAAIATVMLNYNVSIAERTQEPLNFAKGGFIRACEEGIWLRFERRR